MDTKQELSAAAPVSAGEIREPAAEEGNGSARRRGRRGGRRERGERENQNVAAVTETTLAAANEVQVVPTEHLAPAATTSEIDEPAVAVHEKALPEPAIVEPAAVTQNLVEAGTAPTEIKADSTADVPTAPSLPTATPVTEVLAEPAIEALVQVVDVPEQTVIIPPVANETIVMPATAVNIDKALEESGLVMVETSGDKIRSWQPESVSEEAAPRPRRRRPAPVLASEEPLTMVETQK